MVLRETDPHGDGVFEGSFFVAINETPSNCTVYVSVSALVAIDGKKD